MIRITLMTMVAAILYNVYIIHFSMALNVMGIFDQQKIGFYSALATLAVPIGAYLFKYFSVRSPQFQFSLLFTLIGIGLIGIGLSQKIEITIFFAWIQQLGVGMAIPILIAWALNEVPLEFRGRGMGFWTCGFFLGQFISPLAVSAMRNITGNMLYAFVSFGIMCLLVAIFNGLLTKKVAQHEEAI
jgi:MFS family permease